MCIAIGYYCVASGLELLYINIGTLPAGWKETIVAAFTTLSNFIQNSIYSLVEVSSITVLLYIYI